MAATERIALADAPLEFSRHTSAAERAELGRVSLPAIAVGPGELDLPALLVEHAAFGAGVLDGMVMGRFGSRSRPAYSSWAPAIC
jgi:hypothetical protein